MKRLLPLIFLLTLTTALLADEAELLRQATCDCFADDYRPDRGPLYRAAVDRAYHTFAALPDSAYLSPERSFYLPAYLECTHKWLVTAAPPESALDRSGWERLVRLSLTYYRLQRSAGLRRLSPMTTESPWFAAPLTPHDSLAMLALDSILAGNPWPEPLADSALQVLGLDLGKGVTYFFRSDGWQAYLRGSRVRYEPLLLYRTLLVTSALRMGEEGPTVILGMHERDFGSLSSLLYEGLWGWPEEYGP